MRDGVEAYIEDVICYADLARGDERRVRAELTEHLNILAAMSRISDPKEIYAMLKDRFGNPRTIGRAIAAAKGRVRTYFKKLRRKLPWQIGIALVLALMVRHSIAEAFYVTGDGVNPQVPRGSRVLVYKLADSFNPGDVIVFRHSPSQCWMGVIVNQRPDGQWVIRRNSGTATETLVMPRDQIVGRVFLNTR